MKSLAALACVATLVAITTPGAFAMTTVTDTGTATIRISNGGSSSGGGGSYKASGTIYPSLEGTYTLAGGGSVDSGGGGGALSGSTIYPGQFLTLSCTNGGFGSGGSTISGRSGGGMSANCQVAP